MSNHSKLLLKMNHYLHNVTALFLPVFHPAGGRTESEKKRKKTATPPFRLKATPDSQNIRDQFKKQDGFRRNPAP